MTIIEGNERRLEKPKDESFTGYLIYFCRTTSVKGVSRIVDSGAYIVTIIHVKQRVHANCNCYAHLKKQKKTWTCFQIWEELSNLPTKSQTAIVIKIKHKFQRFVMITVQHILDQFIYSFKTLCKRNILVKLVRL